MSSNDDNESLLAPVDLRAWRVPPPVAIDPAALLGRALSPATARPKLRLGWMFAAIIVANAAIAALIGIVTRPDPAPPAAVALPAGGDTDARVRQLLQRIDEQQREIERRFTELEELRTLILELQNKVHSYEERTPPHRQDDPPRKQPARDDEVTPVPSKVGAVDEALTRENISRTISALKPTITACGRLASTSFTLKARVKVAPDGSVQHVSIDETIEAGTAICVRNVLETAKFGPTRGGGSFSYPFVF